MSTFLNAEWTKTQVEKIAYTVTLWSTDSGKLVNLMPPFPLGVRPRPRWRTYILHSPRPSTCIYGGLLLTGGTGGRGRAAHLVQCIGQLSLASPGVAKSSISFGWNKGRNVSSAGWQVTLCDPIWHVSSRRGEAVVHYQLANRYTAFTFLLLGSCYYV